MPVTKVRSEWSGGDLVFKDTAGDIIATFGGDGTLDIVAPKVNGTVLSATGAELNQYAITKYMADAGTAGSCFVKVPHAGNIVGLGVVNDVDNAGAKTVFTAKIATVAVTHAAWEIAVTAAAGVGSGVIAPSAANVVTAGQVIELISDGGSSSVMPVTFTIIISR